MLRCGCKLVEDATIPQLRLIQGVLNSQYLPRFENTERLWIQFDNPLPDDLEQDRADVSGGVRTPNEIRRNRGLPPVEGGDYLQGMYSLKPAELEALKQPEEVTTSTAEAAPIVEAPQQIETLPQNTLNGAQIDSALSIVQAVAARNSAT